MANEIFKSVWDALADTPAEAANLKVRADLTQQIRELISGQDWTQEQAATQCNITQPRLNELLQGRVSKFTLEALVSIAAALGQVVHVKLDAK
jgi:predicted XRE-type DNA-binding protein